MSLVHGGSVPIYRVCWESAVVLTLLRGKLYLYYFSVMTTYRYNYKVILKFHSQQYHRILLFAYQPANHVCCSTQSLLSPLDISVPFGHVLDSMHSDM